MRNSNTAFSRSAILWQRRLCSTGINPHICREAGLHARARQSATLSRLAHEKSVDPALGDLLDALAPYGAGLPYESDEASLIRIARRDFEKAIKLPSDYVVRASELRSASYNAWTRARPGNDFASMVPFLEKAVDLSREYAGFFAPYQHVADPLIDAADEGMTTVAIRSLFAELRRELIPLVRAISAQPMTGDDCLHGYFQRAGAVGIQPRGGQAIRLRP